MVNGEKLTESEKPTTEDGQNADETSGGKGGEQSAEETEPKNDEPQLKTLDEYKRELEEKRMHTQFNIRKPGEGEDKSKWKKTYVLKKKPVAEEEEVEYEEIEVVSIKNVML
ncbi:HABP4-like protein [Euroglyphus maynei]|uniref:HABP4-like protein n=1 Tax=Euroglyphus maynei TaxID=6958 RepID=A0A1Y3B1T9_EURMA|nr:HABP4-like protein [Euroglyphus maynei]